MKSRHLVDEKAMLNDIEMNSWKMKLWGYELD
jgi:hypothetical protein